MLLRQQKCATNGQLNVQKISWLSQNLPLYGVTNAHKTVLSLGSWCMLTVDARRTHIVHLTHKTKTAQMSKGLVVYFTLKLIFWGFLAAELQLLRKVEALTVASQ